MAFSSAGLQGAIIAGPALGGFVYVAGASVPCTACARRCSAWRRRCACASATPTRRPAQPVSLDTLLAGVRYVQQNKVVLGAISLDLFAVLLGGAMALLPIFAKDILHVGPWGLGLLRGAPALGALAMSIVLTRWPIARRAGPKLFAAVAVFGLATLVFGLSTTFAAVDGGAVRHRRGRHGQRRRCARRWCSWRRPTRCAAASAPCNSVFIGASNQLGEFESGATAALARARWARWCWAAPARCWWPRCGGAGSRRWRGAMRWCSDGRQPPPRT